MDKNEALRKYELILIIDARLSSEEKDVIVKGVIETIEKEGGKVVNSQVWIEKQKLTFRIKKCNEGSYYLINYETLGAGIIKIQRSLKLNEKILRTSIVQVKAHKQMESVKN